MSTFRKVCIGIIGFLYLCGIFPPLMAIFNRPGFVFGIPTFIVGLLTLALSMLLVTYILFRHETKNDPD